jgi:L-alanine-DL-glutamate epimerase-like enolase superfamily enzyme
MIDVSARRVWLKLGEPVTTAAGRQRLAEVVEVTVRRGDTAGYGEAAAVGRHGETAATALAFLRDAETRRALGDDAAPDAVRERLARRPGHEAAKAALDAALHDLWGKAAGQPVWRLVGATAATPPSSWTVSLGAPATMADAAAAAPRDVRRLKLKLGGRDGRDVERVAAVRAVTDRPLQVDVNEAWSFEEALASLPELVGYGIELCEQPLRAGDAGAAELKRRSPVPVFLDEECQTVADVPACAERGHGVNVKLAKCGGIGAALMLIAEARRCGLGVMIGCMAESSLGVAAAAHVSSLCDYADLDSNLHLSRDPWQGLAFEGGAQVPADAPGLGVARAPSPRAERVAEAATAVYRGLVRPHLRRAYGLARKRVR